MYGNMVHVALIFASSKEKYSPLKRKNSMREQTITPKSKRLTIHYYATEFIAGQRRFVRRPAIA